MAGLVLWVLILAFIGGSDATWCVCRSEVNTTLLQKTLDYACGTGADCSAILQNGACYQPNSVVAHCSYAANSYFQRKGQVGGTCDFSGTTLITATDPSYAGCSYPSTASAVGTGTATPTPALPGSTTPGTPTPALPGSTTPGTPTLAPPTTFTPGSNNGVLGLGPSGPGSTMSTDAAGLHPNAGPVWLPIAFLLSALLLLRGWP